MLHLADNRGSSEIFGAPRMRACLNNLLDLRKLYGGSAEMYWRGAFPGLSIETQPQLGAEVEIDKAGVRAQMTSYMNGLQRFLALQGMTAKSLAPQVVDPTAQVDVHITSICILMGVPKRLFMGSERGELASGQDSTTWNERLDYRRANYLTPKVIVPFVNRLIMVGVLPRPVGFSVSWPDLESLTEQEKATVAQSKVTSLSTYVSSGLDVLMPPMEFLTRIMSYSEEEAKAILEAAAKAQAQAAVQPQLDENGDPIPPEEQVDEQGNPISPEGETGPDGEPVDADPNKAGIQAMAGRRREKLDAMKEGMQNRDKDKGKEPSMNTLSDEVLTLLLQNSGNCGTGAGGFQPGNSCATSGTSASTTSTRSHDENSQLVIGSSNLVRAIAFRLVAHDRDREDASQAALLKLSQVAHKWDPEKGPWNKWAATVAWNAIQHYKSKQTRGRPKPYQQTTAEGDTFPEQASLIKPPPTKAFKGELIRKLRMAVATLPVNEQEVIRARMEGETQEAIAESKGLTKQRIGQIEANAHRKIKAMLETMRGGLNIADLQDIIGNAAKKQDSPNACGDDGPEGFQGGNTCAKGGGASSEQGSSKPDAPTSAAHKAGEVGKFAAGAAVGAVASAGGGAAGAYAGGGIGGAIGGALTAPIGGVGAVPGAAVGAVIGGLIGSLIAGGAASHVAGQVGGESAQLGAVIGSVAGDIAGVKGLAHGAKLLGGAAKSIGQKAGAIAGSTTKAVSAKADEFVAGRVAKEVGKNAVGIADAAKQANEFGKSKPLFSSSGTKALSETAPQDKLKAMELSLKRAETGKISLKPEHLTKLKADIETTKQEIVTKVDKPVGYGFREETYSPEYFAKRKVFRREADKDITRRHVLRKRTREAGLPADKESIDAALLAYKTKTGKRILTPESYLHLTGNVTPEERMGHTSKALQSQSPILAPQHQAASDHYSKAKEQGLNAQEEAALEALPDMLEGINSVLKTSGPSGLSGDAADTYMNVSTAIVKVGKLPKPLVVFRATSCAAPSDEIEPGMIVQVQGFQVGTLNQSIAENMSSGVILKINAKTGIYLAGTSDRARRGLEFLQNHGTKYKVLGVKESGRLNYILLEELV